MHTPEEVTISFAYIYVRYMDVYIQITKFGRTMVSSTYNTQATYINPTILRINFPPNSRSTSANIWGNGFYISLSYDAKHFGDSLVMIIYNDVCYSCNASTLECTNMVTKHIGLFLLKKQNSS